MILKNRGVFKVFQFSQLSPMWYTHMRQAYFAKILYNLSGCGSGLWMMSIHISQEVKVIKGLNGESWPLVTDELVEFEKEPVDVQDFGKITPHFEGI